ncbi:MAG TPA: hypothetical protein VK642_15000 [Burkholderiales bacterium]|nr:hypothetical protein [Burkholderiales bacterium]
MLRNYRYVVLAVFSSVLVANALVARAQTVELVTKAEREIEVIEKGVKVKKTGPPEKVVPGEEVTYTVAYTNKTGKPAEKIVITNPVPNHTRYRDGSAAGEGADITFSVDGGKNFAAPDRLTVAIKDKSGKDIVRPAVAQDYTHIRWVLKQSVAPGQSGSVRFRVVIL